MHGAMTFDWIDLFDRTIDLIRSEQDKTRVVCARFMRLLTVHRKSVRARALTTSDNFINLEFHNSNKGSVIKKNEGMENRKMTEMKKKKK